MKKEVLAWALYDLANTAFTSPFRTIFWPLLVTSFLGGNELHIGATVGVAFLLVGLIVPVFGAFSDLTNRRIPFILWPTLGAVALIVVLPLFPLFWNLVLTAVIIVLYTIALTAYNSLLSKIAKPAEMGRVSGLGMAFGFLGTLLSLAATYLALRFFAVGDTLESASGVYATFPVMAGFFLFFSLPLFFVVKDGVVVKTEKTLFSVLRGMLATLRNIAKIRGMMSFGISTFLFANALAAIDVFFFLFAKKEIGIGLAGFMLLFAFQSIGAASGAYTFGRLADRIGPKKTLFIAGLLWILTVSFFIVSKSMTIFWAAGLIGSVAFGAVFSASRTLFVFLVPPPKIGEFFGYGQILGKFSGLFGPVAAGALIVTYNYTVALVGVFMLLLVAVLVLRNVPDVRNTPGGKHGLLHH